MANISLSDSRKETAQGLNIPSRHAIRKRFDALPFSVQQQPLHVERPVLASFRPPHRSQEFPQEFFQAISASLQGLFIHASQCLPIRLEVQHILNVVVLGTGRTGNLRTIGSLSPEFDNLVCRHRSNERCEVPRRLLFETRSQGMDLLSGRIEVNFERRAWHSFDPELE